MHVACILYNARFIVNIIQDYSNNDIKFEHSFVNFSILLIWSMLGIMLDPG